MGGLFTLWLSSDPLTNSAGAGDSPSRIGRNDRTAVVMAVYDEEVDSVYAGLHARYRSLAGGSFQ